RRSAVHVDAGETARRPGKRRRWALAKWNHARIISTEEESMKQHRVKCFFALLATILLGAISLSLSVTAAKSQERKLPEPESIGVCYFLDSVNNSLLPMERQLANSKKRGFVKNQN